MIATGRALAPLVAAGGYEHVELALGSGSNTGIRPSGADPEIDAFFAATREGMIATLRYQAERRRHDLLWKPQAERPHRIVARLAAQVAEGFEVVKTKVARSGLVAAKLSAVAGPALTLRPIDVLAALGK